MSTDTGTHFSEVGLEQLRQQVHHFAIERDWQQYHTPRNLLLALTGEATLLASPRTWLVNSQRYSSGGVKSYLSSQASQQQNSSTWAKSSLMCLYTLFVCQMFVGSIWDKQCLTSWPRMQQSILLTSAKAAVPSTQHINGMNSSSNGKGQVNKSLSSCKATRATNHKQQKQER